MSAYIKSITPVQIPGEGWTVRVRFVQGTEKLMQHDAPYTLAQAQCACDSLRRDIRNHGAAVLDSALA